MGLMPNHPTTNMSNMGNAMLNAVAGMPPKYNLSSVI